MSVTRLFVRFEWEKTAVFHSARDQFIYRRWRTIVTTRNGIERLSIYVESLGISVILYACVSNTKCDTVQSARVRLRYDSITCHVEITRAIRKIYKVWTESTCHCVTRDRQSIIKRYKTRMSHFLYYMVKSLFME